MTSPNHEMQLRDAHILVVEDEAILALDLAFTLEDAGATVAGPLHRIEQALAFHEFATLDAAVLDVDVSGREVFPVADLLAENAVPLVFYTGRGDLSDVLARYPRTKIVRKPAPVPLLVTALAREIATSSNGRKAAAS